MLNWLKGSRTVEEMIPEGAYQEAIDHIHLELNKGTSKDRSRSLRRVLAEALVLADRKAEALSVLRDLAKELLETGAPGKAIAIQKRLEQLDAGAKETGQALDLITKAVAHGGTEEAVAATPLFSDFERDELRAIIRGFKLRRHEPGEVLMIEGEPGDSLFILADGTVRVYVRRPDGRSVQVRELYRSEFFGEISILREEPRTATLTCKTRCDILELDRETVSRIQAEHPNVEKILADFCEQRLKSSQEARGIDQG